MDDKDPFFVGEQIIRLFFVFRLSKLRKWATEPLVKRIYRVENLSAKRLVRVSELATVL
jgi:hypothetical protein